MVYTSVISCYKSVYYLSIYFFGTRSYERTGWSITLNILRFYGGLKSKDILLVDVLIYP